MKARQKASALLALAVLLTGSVGGKLAVTDRSGEADSSRLATTEIRGWGKAIDPDKDCAFIQNEGELRIDVPGDSRPHDLAAEINTTNAPRVLQRVRGDFTMQVRVDGRFRPGDESTQPGRTGYNGAALIAMAGPQNVVTLARAVLHARGGRAMGYANFELRTHGELERIGYANEHPLPGSGPVFLRLERRGQKILAAVSKDGMKWDELEPKELPSGWPQELQVGIAAISTSAQEFSPRFSRFQLLK